MHGWCCVQLRRQPASGEKKKGTTRKKKEGKPKQGHEELAAPPPEQNPAVALAPALRPRQSWAQELQLEGSGPHLVLRLTRECDLLWDFFFLPLIFFCLLSCGRMTEGVRRGGWSREGEARCS